MQIIRHRRGIRCIEYGREFEWRDTPGAGFSFPCDEHGEIIREGMAPPGLANLEACLSGQFDVIDKGVKDWSRTVWLPAVGRCSTCGAEVVLDHHFTNECTAIHPRSGKVCGALYNGCGQELAPRSQWDSRGEY